jgi:Protein of unknown function (DUF2917)
MAVASHNPTMPIDRSNQGTAMRIDIFDQAVELGANRTIVLHEARRAEIVCTRGRIWITEDPLRNDIVLEAGKSHMLDADGLAFVTGMTASTVWLREPLHVAARPQARPAGVLAAAAAALARLAARLRGRTTAAGAPA